MSANGGPPIDAALASVIAVGKFGPEIAGVLAAARICSAGVVSAYRGTDEQFATLIVAAAGAHMPASELDAISDLAADRAASRCPSREGSDRRSHLGVP